MITEWVFVIMLLRSFVTNWRSEWTPPADAIN